MSSGLSEGRPFTDTVDAGDAETLTYQLPTAGRFDIDAVVADIDNTAGADAKPILYAADPSGAILAKKAQGDPMPGGDSGSATWALRLADSAAAAAATGASFADFREFTQSVVGTTATMRWLLNSTTDPANYSVNALDDKKIDVQQAGIYSVVADVAIGFTLPVNIAANLRTVVLENGVQSYWAEYILKGKPAGDFPGSPHTLGQIVGIVDRSSIGAPFTLGAQYFPTQAFFNPGIVRLRVMKLD